MAKDQSGIRWPDVPLAGAFGAGQSDELPQTPAGFSLTPSAQQEEVAGAGPEQPGEGPNGGL